MTTTFFIADTHFGHENIIKYEPVLRPFATIEEHNEELIKRWNAKVTPNDTVWHLGDVLFKQPSFSILSRLNGMKRLVLGNHDHFPMALYAEHFVEIRGCLAFKKYILTHIPVDRCQFPRFEGNIHGHLHSEKIEGGFHHCVSVEQTDLAPIAFEELFLK